MVQTFCFHFMLPAHHLMVVFSMNFGSLRYYQALLGLSPGALGLATTAETPAPTGSEHLRFSTSSSPLFCPPESVS